MSVVAWVVLAIAVDGAAGLAGGLVPERILERRRSLLLGFAIGALVAAVSLDLAPDALHALGWRAVAWAAAGAIAILVVERLGGHRHGAHGHDDEPDLLHAAPHPDADPHARRIRYGLLVSDALHNFGDGMAIAAAFLESVHAGLATAVAVIVHEVPEEIADYALLRAGGLRRGKALLALAGVQMTAALGAAATLAGASRLAGLADVAVAVAAGTFVAIIVLLAPPLARAREGRGQAAVGAVIGAAAVAAVTLL